MGANTGQHSIGIRTDTDGDHARLVPEGPFNLDHAVVAARALDGVPTDLAGRRSVDIDFTHVVRIDGAGAVLLARLIDRLDANGHRTRVLEHSNPEAAQLIALYRAYHADRPAAPTRGASALARMGDAAAQLPRTVTDALHFTGGCAIAATKTVAAPASVDWRSIPKLLQEIGAAGLIVTGAANLLVGVI